MNKVVISVFMIAGTLVIVFIFWQLTFANDGILRDGYNALANFVNTRYASVAGEGATILPEMGDTQKSEYASIFTSLNNDTWPDLSLNGY